MTEKCLIFAVAELPKELVHAWMQHLRDFDVLHPECHFQLAVDAPAMTIPEVIEALRVKPELTIQEIIRRNR